MSCPLRRYISYIHISNIFTRGFHSTTLIRPWSYWCLVGNGWDWGNGMIIDSYCGSFPHSLLSTSKDSPCIHVRRSPNRFASNFFEGLPSDRSTVDASGASRSPRMTPRRPAIYGNSWLKMVISGSRWMDTRLYTHPWLLLRICGDLLRKAVLFLAGHDIMAMDRIGASGFEQRSRDGVFHIYHHGDIPSGNLT